VPPAEQPPLPMPPTPVIHAIHRRGVCVGYGRARVGDEGGLIGRGAGDAGLAFGASNGDETMPGRRAWLVVVLVGLLVALAVFVPTRAQLGGRDRGLLVRDGVRP
jgi:hypothetical protein